MAAASHDGGASAVQRIGNSRVLRLCSAIDTVRSLLYGRGRSLHAQPPDADRCSLPPINNPHRTDPATLQPPFQLPSLPATLEQAGFDRRHHGGDAVNHFTRPPGHLPHSPSLQVRRGAPEGKTPPASLGERAQISPV